MRGWKYTVWLSCVLSLLALSACIKEELPDEPGVVNYVTVGDEVPSFTVSDGAGGTFTSASFTGKRSLLVFFHTGCGDCQRELPKVNALWKTLQGEEGYQVIAIAREEKLSSVAVYWNSSKNKFTMPFYLDTDRSVFSLFANSMIPRLYIIDSYGIVQWMAIETLGDMTDKELLRLMKDVT